jgi:hypothetical protein
MFSNVKASELLLSPEVWRIFESLSRKIAEVIRCVLQLSLNIILMRLLLYC